MLHPLDLNNTLVSHSYRETTQWKTAQNSWFLLTSAPKKGQKSSLSLLPHLNGPSRVHIRLLPSSASPQVPPAASALRTRGHENWRSASSEWVLRCAEIDFSSGSVCKVAQHCGCVGCVKYHSIKPNKKPPSFLARRATTPPGIPQKVLRLVVFWRLNKSISWRIRLELLLQVNFWPHGNLVFDKPNRICA